MRENPILEKKVNALKRIIALLLITLLLLSGCGAEKIGTDYDFSAVREETLRHIIEEAPDPGHSHLNGEWTVIIAAREKAEIPEGWFDIYYENLCEYLDENKGELSSTKHGDYSRAVLTLSAIGRDITDVGGYNILESYNEFDFVTKQGISGSIFALLSLDCVGHGLLPESDVTREKLIDYILEREYDCGGWALIGEEPDADITAQAIQALAPYYGNDAEVTAAVDRAVEHLSSVQKDDGGFFAWESENSQTSAQVMIALCSIGINPREDERFIKSGGWIGSYIMQYYLGGGAFEHTLGFGENSMASDQCMMALLSLEYLEQGEKRFYDFG